MRRYGIGVLLAFLIGCERQSRVPAGPEPLPSPSPVPTAVPTPTAPAVFGCGLPRGPGLGRGCPFERPSYLNEVNSSIDQVIAEFPEFFDLNSARGGERNYKIRNVPQYVDEVVYNLRTRGFCALNDGEEIAVKSSNDFNDQYDVITAEAFISRAYRATCRPAWDAIPPAGDE
jgi:hypothetical protein